MPIPEYMKPCDYGRIDLSETERALVENADAVELLAESTDPDACYAYDDFALLKYGETYYVINTCGCSCPDPSETWGIVFETADRAAIVPWVVKDRSYVDGTTGSAARALLAALKGVGFDVPETTSDERNW